MIHSKTTLHKEEYIEIIDNHYVNIDKWKNLNDSDQHLLICNYFNKRRKGLVFTGESNCAISGIPRFDKFGNRPHCTTRVRRSTDIICWRNNRIEPETYSANNFTITSPIHTVCDLAQFDSEHSLLASINHCLFQKLFTKEQILSKIDAGIIVHGKSKIKKVLTVANDKCESPLETLAWIAINNAGFLLPKQQVDLYDTDGFIGRVDMLWQISNRKIVLELDGMMKYKDIKDLHNEKIREDRLRRLKYEVIRATWKSVKNKDSGLIRLLEDAHIPKRKYFKRSMI